VLGKPFVWGRLKELLRTGKARIENLGAQYMLFPSASLEPEAMDVDLTVVLIGSTELYRLLHALDPDVARLFKVRADFDSRSPWDEETVGSYAAFVSKQVREGGLLHFDRSAIARLVEHGARLAEDRERISIRLPDIEDIVQEAAYRARQDGAPLVTAAHVERCLRDRRRRSDLPAERIRELTVEGDLHVDLSGDTTGQVNGLAVVSLGDDAFGHPVRITATVAAGDGKVVDIDREAELSGPIHDKGVLILAGLLRHLYCRDIALALRASLVFEQSYGPVEGDSASSAELLALLSALADVPVHQRVGVTGSVDQHGHIQAIGAVNEKIEGFFALCREEGLTGDQGVVIPAANLRHLMLDHEVVEAVRDGRFHVWAVETIDEAIELLTGMIAGAPEADGSYPEDTFHGRAQARIARLAELARDAHRPAGTLPAD
jgi:predicted ATP-dependent protease